MGEKKGIWVVDDDAIAVTIVSHLIGRQENLELLNSFGNAGDMLEAFKQCDQYPDLIILDLNMPMMSGWDLLEEMKTDFSLNAIKVAIFTSSIDERDRKKAENYPCVIGYFVKPMTRNILGKIAQDL